MGTIVSANFQIKTKQNTIGKRLEKNILKNRAQQLQLQIVLLTCFHLTVKERKTKGHTGIVLKTFKTFWH